MNNRTLLEDWISLKNHDKFIQIFGFSRKSKNSLRKIISYYKQKAFGFEYNIH